MIEELATVVFTRDMAAPKLQAGDLGTIVHVHRGGEAYEVEFATLDGQTLAVVTLPAAAVRPVTGCEIAHVSEIV